jgi:hypothetical protein
VPSDTRADQQCWQADCLFEFRELLFDGTAQLAQSISQSASVDTLNVDKGAAAVRLVLKAGKDLDALSMSFAGGALTSPPSVAGVASAPESGGLNIDPATAMSKGSVVLDLALQGLVPGRPLSIMTTGQKNKKAVAGASSTLTLAVESAPNPAKTTAGSP